MFSPASSTPCLFSFYPLCPDIYHAHKAFCSVVAVFIFEAKVYLTPLVLKERTIPFFPLLRNNSDNNSLITGEPWCSFVGDF